MTIVYVLAHFDDEYCALPLIRRALAEDRDLRFIYVADYRDPRVAARRLAETRAFLGREGVVAESVLHLGAGTGWWDGELHRHAGAALEALAAAVPGPIEGLVVTAWEGGHPDHDICAALAVKLAAARGGPPVEQFCLYQGQAMPWILYRACWPLAENGPVRTIRLAGREWAGWLAAIRAFPSQWPVFLGLLPAMAMSFLRLGEFRYQALDPQRIGERPHGGPLHYERLFKVPYAAVREAVDRLG